MYATMPDDTSSSWADDEVHEGIRITAQRRRAGSASTAGSWHAVVVTHAERERLVAFLRSKQCGPCRRGDAKREHPGCVEAEELIEIVEKD